MWEAAGPEKGADSCELRAESAAVYGSSDLRLAAGAVGDGALAP